MLDYFDINSILSQQEKIICKQTNERLEMPFWLAHEMALQELVTLEELPRCFKVQVQQDLASHPESLNLRELSQSFWMYAICLLERIETEPQFKAVLQQAIRKRLSFILRRAESEKAEESFDELEKMLYNTAFKSQQEFKEWWSK